MEKPQQFLYEVVPIRLFLIVMLVFYHAFAIFTGAWKPIAGYPEIPGYALLGNLSYACLLETFVFISGYVFGYQVRVKGDTALSAKKLLVKKFKRLIIPSIIFSIAYLLIIKGFHDSLLTTSYQILCGVAHMWFLPMLFWCFVIVWIIEKLKLKKKYRAISIIGIIDHFLYSSTIETWGCVILCSFLLCRLPNPEELQNRQGIAQGYDSHRNCRFHFFLHFKGLFV